MIDKARRAKHVSSILLNKFCANTIRKEKVPTKCNYALSRVGGAHADLPPAPAGHLLCPGLGAARAVQASSSPVQGVCQRSRVCGNNIE